MHKSILTLMGGALLFLTSCQNGNNSANLEGNWQAVSIESPTEDSMLQVQMTAYNQQIDIITEINPEMEAQYHSKNIDSVKALMREEVKNIPNQMEEQRKMAVDNFKLELLKGGIVIQRNDAGVDSAKWYLADNNTKLVLDPIELEKPGDVMMFKIVESKSGKLKLQVHQQAGYKMFINLEHSK